MIFVVGVSLLVDIKHILGNTDRYVQKPFWRKGLDFTAFLLFLASGDALACRANASAKNESLVKLTLDEIYASRKDSFGRDLVTLGLDIFKMCMIEAKF